MSEAAVKASSTKALAPILAAAAVALALCFAVLQYLLPAFDLIDAPSNFSASMESICAGLLTAALMIGVRLRELRWQSRRMRIALDNMSQGLCMFDGSERLVVCNQRYLEMYALSREVVRPGITLLELLQARIAAGSFARKADDYRRELLASIADGKTNSLEVTTAEGHTILVVNRPMPGGGWVATHEDVTERRSAERERISMQQQHAQREAVERAIEGFRHRVEELLRTVADGAMTMRSTARILLESSGRTAKCAESALTASNVASSNVETAAAAADELTGSIAEIGRQLDLTTGIVGAAAAEATDTNNQITALAQAAQKIGNVIKLIRAIAGQTNLLALNATIEAARAGDAGKGFAVVAAEVKSLAVQTAKATEDISTLIKSVQGATEGAVDAIGRIAARMQEIDSCATAVSASVSQQSSATSEISHNVTGAADGAKLVVSVLDEVTHAAGDTRRSAEDVLTASQEVEAAAAALRGEVEGFLQRVAA